MNSGKDFYKLAKGCLSREKKVRPDAKELLKDLKGIVAKNPLPDHLSESKFLENWAAEFRKCGNGISYSNDSIGVESVYAQPDSKDFRRSSSIQADRHSGNWVPKYVCLDSKDLGISHAKDSKGFEKDNTHLDSTHSSSIQADRRREICHWAVSSDGSYIAAIAKKSLWFYHCDTENWNSKGLPGMRAGHWDPGWFSKSRPPPPWTLPSPFKSRLLFHPDKENPYCVSWRNNKHERGTFFSVSELVKGEWVVTKESKMKKQRDAFAVAMSSDGKQMFAVGGKHMDTKKKLRTAECYDTEKNKWKMLPGKMQVGRSGSAFGFSVVMSLDGKSMYATGGSVSGKNPSVERYDFERKSWEMLPARMNDVVLLHGATMAPDGTNLLVL